MCGNCGILHVMNGTPHTHQLYIFADRKGWDISYGDQRRLVKSPRFRNPEKVLANATRDIIARHDRESLKAEARERNYKEVRRLRQETADAILNSVALDPNRWGSKQLADSPK